MWKIVVRRSWYLVLHRTGRVGWGMWCNAKSQILCRIDLTEWNRHIVQDRTHRDSHSKPQHMVFTGVIGRHRASDAPC